MWKIIAVQYGQLAMFGLTTMKLRFCRVLKPHKTFVMLVFYHKNVFLFAKKISLKI